MHRYPPRSSTISRRRNSGLSWQMVLMGLAFVVVFISGVAVTIGSAFANQQAITITVDEKERVCDGSDSCRYLIFTERNGVLENTDSLLHGKFNSSDLYNEVEPGETYEVTTVGWRIPFLSMYPNILDVR